VDDDNALEPERWQWDRIAGFVDRAKQT